MQPARAITPDTLRLSEGVQLHCDWDADLYTLVSPEGAVALNRTAAAVLTQCDGRSTQRELMIRFGRGDLVQARQVGAFIEAALERRWIAHAW